MDVFMPVMSGFKATKRIRDYEKVNELLPTPIVIITGNYIKKVRLKAERYEVNDFLAKPLEVDILY